MAHERELFVKANKNEQCNGFRPRRWYCKGYTFVLCIPRSRSGNFYPVLLGIIRSECEERTALVYQLYTKGLTTEQISEVIETVYGRAYSKQQIFSFSYILFPTNIIRNISLAGWRFH